MKKDNLKKILLLLLIVFVGAVLIIGKILLSSPKEEMKNTSLTEEYDKESLNDDKKVTEDTVEKTKKDEDLTGNDKETAEIQSDKNEILEDEENAVSDSEKIFQKIDGKELQETDLKNGETDETTVKEEVKFIQFPYEIEQSSLVIQCVQAYSGSYVEDGTNEQVSDIAAILVTNVGNECVEFADITLTSEKGTLKFSLSALEKGASCVVMEDNRTVYEKQTYLTCTSETAFLDEMEMSENMVEVEEIKSGALTVKNVSSKTIPCIRIFYKYYDEEEKIYIGGAAYTSQITDLEAGYSKIVTPAHYLSGKSKVIMVRTYESYE